MRALRICHVVALWLAVSQGVLAAIDEAAVHRAVVRVLANGNAASGFVYGAGNRQVVTALHAVLPATRDIKVACRGNEAPAVVKKVLKKADLVLLETGEDLELLGCRGLGEFSSKKPGLGDSLYAFGFRPDNTVSAFSKSLEKASGDPETLYGLVPDKARKQMTKLGMPDVTLPVYYVNGGIYPGFSGGPVFNKAGELIGVVQGGLDKGTSNHDWLIPAHNIAVLMGTPDTSTLPPDDPSKYGYSSPSATQNENNYIEKQLGDFYYKWVKTKTRTLDEISVTSDPAEGLDQLLEIILPEVETRAERELTFDIYQELDLGLIIAIPTGQRLKYEDVDGVTYLVAVGPDGEQGDQAMLRVQHGRLYMTDAQGHTVAPGDEQFFELAVAQRLANCKNVKMKCYRDDALMRIVDFGSGNKILRMGYQIVDESEDGSAYLYESLVVKGDELLVAQALVNFGEDSAVRKCIEEETHVACGPEFWGPASFMLAAQLTSFSNLVVDDNEIVITTVDYGAEFVESQPLAAQPASPAVDTLAMTYYVDNVATFKHQGGQTWWVYQSGEYVSAFETSRDENYVVFQHNNFLYRLPITGGEFYHSWGNSGWVAAGTAIPWPSVNTFALGYYQDSVETFRHVDGTTWLFNVQGQWQTTTEISRNLHAVFLQYGNLYYSLPLRGGQYYWALDLQGPWTAAGVLQMQSR